MPQDRLARLERQVRALQASLVGACCVIGVALLAGFQVQRDQPSVLRVRGIIVEDSLGRERILIGAPIPAASRRVRTDTARVARIWGPRFPRAYLEYYKGYRHDMDGLLVLDANGFDRVAIGQNVPDPNIGRRIAPSTGMIINDSLGFERSGYGLLSGKNIERVVLGLDISGSEAVALVADENGSIGLMARDSARSLYLGTLPTLEGAAGGRRSFGLQVKDGSRVQLRLPNDSSP